MALGRPTVPPPPLGRSIKRDDDSLTLIKTLVKKKHLLGLSSIYAVIVSNIAVSVTL